MTGIGVSPRLAVLVPTIGVIYSRPFFSLTTAVAAGACWWRKKFGWDSGYQMYLAERMPLDQARNALAATAVQYDADWCLWLDDDVDLPPDVLERLWPAAQETGVASVALNMKKHGHGVLAYLFQNGTSERLLLPKWEGVIEVDGAGMGCVLMRGDVAGAARFRILVVTRGESAVQSLVLDGPALELPKFKLTETASYGTLMHAQNPTADYKEAIDELAYRYMPMTSN